MKGVMRFREKGKLNPRYIGPYQIRRKIENVTYELELPTSLDRSIPYFMYLCLRSIWVTILW